MDFDDQEDVFIAEQEEGEVKERTSTKEEVLFLVDSSASMFRENGEHHVPFFMVIEAILGFYKDRILSSDSDNIAVVFFNTNQSKNHMNFSGLYVFHEPSPPDANRIKEVQELFTSRKVEWGNADSLLVEALWLAHDLLTQKQTGSYKRILLFTDEDNPNAANANDRRRALQRARDLAEQGIEIELFPFNRRDHKFDFNAFFAEAIAIDEEDKAEPIEGYDGLQEFLRTIHKKEVKKRRLGTIDFMLGPNLKVAVNYYCMLRQISKPNPVKLYAPNNKKLKTVTSWVCEETGRQLWVHELGYHYELGAYKVPFTKEEIKYIKEFDCAGIKLMGFKDRSFLRDVMNIRPAYFIYPEESRIKGSSQTMHSLLVSMEKLGKVGIVRVIPRAGALVRFAALVPHNNPQGFYMIFMPYADDMRSLSIFKQEEAPPDYESIEKAREMIRNIQLDGFSIEHYYNPTIQHFYSRLEALALELPMPKPIEDTMIPDETGFIQKQNVIQDFFKNSNAPAPLKRQPDKKKPEKKTNHDEGALQKMRVPELKEMCEGLGISKAGNKKDLIDRILAFNPKRS